MSIKTTSALALSSALLASTLATADISQGTNPFSLNEISGYAMPIDHNEEDKGGEGKCGEDKKMKEGSCGEKPKTIKKDSTMEGKCGEGKCGS